MLKILEEHIFVVHPQMMINAQNYISSCFYQLLDYYTDSAKLNYSVKFVNNSAAKGGDHIYGASLISTCTCALIDYNNTLIDSHQIFDDVFQFDPWDKSAISADATRVCVCDDNGEPQCGTVMTNLEAYPGQHFSLQLVVVGGDYGTTTGNVYTSFLNQNSTSESVLGSPDQQHQIINKNTECSMLNFSVYSNESHDTLFLKTQETPMHKSAED